MFPGLFPLGISSEMKAQYLVNTYLSSYLSFSSPMVYPNHCHSTLQPGLLNGLHEHATGSPSKHRVGSTIRYHELEMDETGTCSGLVRFDSSCEVLHQGRLRG